MLNVIIVKYAAGGSSSSNVGAIAGGVIGALAGIILIVAFIILGMFNTLLNACNWFL